jgi:hypothetical protein
MFKQILGILFICALVAFILIWVVNGGIGKIIKNTGSFQNPISAWFSGQAIQGSNFRLPAQKEVSGINVDDMQIDATPQELTVFDVTGGSGGAPMSSFGNPSSYAGHVHLLESMAQSADPNSQYLTINISGNNSAPVELSGWTLQSAVSGTRVTIPGAVRNFYSGVVNQVDATMIRPGGKAYIISGTSPVGVSFQETMCSGYLSKFQSFTPDMDSGCPDPSEALPETADNLRQYGAACLDYVRALGTCEFPSIVPPSLPAACRVYVINTFSYNGCVNMYRNNRGFDANVWHLYLGDRTTPWNPTHDIIRLLDDQNRIVDSVTY